MIIGIIPCSKEKIWDIEPLRGSVRADQAYRSAFHRYAAKYAQRHCTHTLIFSAKYGLMEPNFIIEGSYDITFSRKEDPCITLQTLKAQAELYTAATSIIVLCPHAYAQKIETIFAPLPPDVQSPLRGIGGFGAMHRYLQHHSTHPKRTP